MALSQEKSRRALSLTPDHQRGYIRCMMWIVAGVLTVAAAILGAVGIRIKTTRH